MQDSNNNPDRDKPAQDRGPSESDGSDSSQFDRSEELFDRWTKEGEQSAARRLTKRYRSRLMRLVAKRLPPDMQRRFEPDDLVQETLARTLDKAKHFEDRGKGSLWAWVRGISNHVLKDAWRRSSRDRTDKLEVDESLQHPPTPEDGPLDRIVDIESKELVFEALKVLGEREQKAVLLRWEMGLSYKAVAQASGYPSADAARMALRRALAELTDELKRLGEASLGPQ